MPYSIIKGKRDKSQARERDMKPLDKKHSFTLVELIVTIMIALIIISLTAGMIMEVGAGTRLDSGAKLVGAQLLRGRQIAQSKRQLVAVIMPGKNANIEVTKKYGAIRVALVTADESKTPVEYNFDSYVDDTQWAYLRPGVSIMEADADCGIVDSGTVQEEPVDNTVTVVQNVDLEELGGGASEDNIRAVIFSSSGRLKGTGHRFITVGQANFNAGRWMIKNAAVQNNRHGTLVNKSSANQLTLEVNRYTGGLRYINYSKYPSP
jgi:Tfp pilus assembly protein FimT